MVRVINNHHQLHSYMQRKEERHLPTVETQQNSKMSQTFTAMAPKHPFRFHCSVRLTSLTR